MHRVTIMQHTLKSFLLYISAVTDEQIDYFEAGC